VQEGSQGKQILAAFGYDRRPRTQENDQGKLIAEATELMKIFGVILQKSS
jgi:hypothetical protein